MKNKTTCILTSYHLLHLCRLSIENVCLWAIPDSKVHGDNMGVHLGPIGPRWAPCWPHEPCYRGCFSWIRLSSWSAWPWPKITDVLRGLLFSMLWWEGQTLFELWLGTGREYSVVPFQHGQMSPKNKRKWLNGVLYLVIWYPIVNLLQSYKSRLLKFSETWF